MSSEKTVGFAIIGTGNIAGFHAGAIGKTAGAHLVAVHSRRAEPGQAFAEKYSCRYEPSLDALLADPEIQAVAITTPSGTHLELSLQAARAGKHVLCEKPLDITTERVNQLIEACQDAGVKLGAIFQSRMGPGAQKVRAAIQAGRFGQLVQCSAYIPWYRSAEYYASAGWRGTKALDGGGALMNQGIHAIDLLLWLAGDVAEVSARIDTRTHKGLEVEDNAAAWLRFHNGSLGVIQGSTCCFPGEPKRVEIFGDKGSATLVDDTITLWKFSEERPEDAAITGASSTVGGGASNPMAISDQGHCLQYADFVEAILHNREPAIAGADARRAVTLIEAIYRSSASKQIVTL